jgi:hypothetical protein
MNVPYEILGELLQIIGVMIVLLSQVLFGYRAWRKCGSMKKTFFAMISVGRVVGEELLTKGKYDDEKLKKQTDDHLKKTFPEWYTLAEYLSSDIWITVVGLVVTLVGLAIALLEGSVQLPIL